MRIPVKWGAVVHGLVPGFLNVSRLGGRSRSRRGRRSQEWVLRQRKLG